MKRILFLTAIMILCFPLFIVADGILIIEPPDYPPSIHVVPRPRPPQPPAPQALPVKYHRVKVEIESQVAKTSIDQVFRNPYGRDLEGTYIFPLPEDAAISEFALYMDGKRITGEILEKDEARKIYEDIVRRMQDPGLLEYVGRNMFRARVYPIPANGEKRIDLTYYQTLKLDSGMVRYTYPLNTERFSPDPIEDVSVKVAIKSPIPIKSLYSPSHEVDASISGNEATCGFEQKDVKPDKDFQVIYTVSEKDLGINILTHRRSGEDGYFMMLVSPGDTDDKPLPKDVIFVLDTSGSMQGAKIKQALDALSYCVQGLNPEDRFNIVNFATSVNTFRNNLLPADKSAVAEAVEFINNMKARGGTDINSALERALASFDADASRPRLIVFITDGQPTVGITAPEAILDNLTSANKSRVRIFPFGVGYDVNTHLLDKIAQIHRGDPEYVLPEENIEVKVSAFFDKVGYPVLSDMRLDFGAITPRDVYPNPLPDLFKGGQVIILGRYGGKGHSAVTLSGMKSEKKMEYVAESSFPEKESSNDFIPRLWATRRIGHLLGEIRFKGENRELRDEIIALSREFGIVTPYTSFLVLEDEKQLVDSSRRPGIQPTSAPARFEEQARMLKSQTSGSQAVRMAQDIVQMKRAEQSASSTHAESIRQVGYKTFIIKDTHWVDTAFKDDMKVEEIEYMSERYFELLKKNPEIGKFLAIHFNVTIVYNGKAYRITKKD